MTLEQNPEPSSAGAPSPLRRKYLVDRKFQLKYTLWWVLSGALISLVVGTIACFVQADVERSLAQEAARMGSRALEQAAIERLLKESFTTFLILTGGAALFMTAALAFLGVLVTHRVAGPIYVMSNYLDALAHGRHPLVRPLRKKDELKPFFEQLRSVCESWREREEQDVDAIREALAKLKPGLIGEEAQAAFSDLNALCERKRGVIGGHRS